MAAKTYKSPLELFKQSYGAVRRNLGVFLILNVLTVLDLAWNLGTNVREKTHGADWGTIFTNSLFGSNGSYPSVGGGILIAVLAILAIILALMAEILAIRAAQHNKVELGDIWNEFKVKGLRLLLLEILLVIIVGAGLILLIIPGVYLIGRLAIAPYVLIDKNTKVVEALNRSWELTKGRMWQIYTVILFGIVLALPNVIPFFGPIIAFALALAYSVALPLRYLELKGRK